MIANCVGAVIGAPSSRHSNGALEFEPAERDGIGDDDRAVSSRAAS
jgi:hypothetical protein